MHLDPAPARQHHGQQTTRFLLRRRFPGGQLHRHQPAGRRSNSTLSLPALPPDDDSACRSSNPASGKTCCVACRCSQTPPPTAEPLLANVAWALPTSFLRSVRHFNTDTSPRTGVLVKRLRSRAVPPDPEDRFQELVSFPGAGNSRRQIRMKLQTK